VTAKVLAHEKGKKIVIGKYKKRTGYKRHNGFRAALSRVQIESIGKKATRAAAPKQAAAEDKPKTAPKPKAAASTPAAAKKPAARKTTTTKKKAE
jgi:hypothetical protein